MRLRLAALLTIIALPGFAQPGPPPIETPLDRVAAIKAATAFALFSCPGLDIDTFAIKRTVARLGVPEWAWTTRASPRANQWGVYLARTKPASCQHVVRAFGPQGELVPGLIRVLN